jgi:hypothetical protein
MKRRLLPLLVPLLTCLPQTRADIVADMIGSWVSEQTLYDKGLKVSATGSAKTVRYGSKGLQTTSTVRVNGATATSVGWLHDSGTFLGYVKQGANTIAVMDGTWRVSGKALVTNVTVHALKGDYTQNASTVKLQTGELQSDSTTSTGLTLKGISRR